GEWRRPGGRGPGCRRRAPEALSGRRYWGGLGGRANRHDWLSAFSNELGVVLAAERLARIEVPPRAIWARTLLAELNRVLSHLAFLSSYPPEIAGPAAGGEPGRSEQAAFEAREALQAIMEEISGGRMHYMFNRVGGLKEAIPAGWLDRVPHTVDGVGASL